MGSSSKFFVWKAKLQVKIQQDRRLNICSSPWSFSSLLNQITFQIILHNNENSRGAGTKPVLPVSKEEIKMLF